MKRLPPAIQEDYLYLKFKVEGSEKSIGDVVDGVWSSALNYMGTGGVSEADIWIVGNKFDEAKQEGVVKIKSSREDDLRAALTLNSGFEDESFLSVVKVSGTVSGLE